MEPVYICAGQTQCYYKKSQVCVQSGSGVISSVIYLKNLHLNKIAPFLQITLKLALHICELGLTVCGLEGIRFTRANV